mgnify:FL=1
MGRLMDRLKVHCRSCDYKHIPLRLSARYHDDEGKRIQLWQCKKCGHFWQDSVFKKKTP